MTSLTLVTGQFSTMLFGYRALAYLMPPANALGTALAAVALIESQEAEAQTPEDLGSTSGAVDPDDPDAIQRGRAAAASALGNVQRPGMDSDGFSIRIQRPDGSNWVQDFGTRADGTTYDMSDLDSMRGGYGDSLSSEVQAEHFSSPEADFMRGTFKDHGHTGVHNDPGIMATEEALRKMEYTNSFQTLYGDCGTLARGNQNEDVLPGTPPETCYRVESPPVLTCSIDNEIRIRSTDNVPTAVVIVVDRSGSMSGARMDAAKAATLRIAQTLDVAKYTEYAVFAYSGNGTPSPGDYYTLTDFNESVADAGIAARYSAMTASGGTPTSTTMDHLSHMLAARSEPRKIMLVVTDGEPTTESTCPYSPTCTPRGVQSNYAGIINYAAVGIQLASVATHFDTYRIVTSTNESELSTAMYDLLSGATGWFSIYNVWSPQSCINTAKQVESGRYTGSLQCIDPPDASGCNEIDGLLVCAGAGYSADMIEPPVGGFGKTCGAVGVSDIRFCWTGVDGISHCLNDDGSSDVPMCKELTQDPGCGRLTSTCIESTRDENGICRVFYEEYRCGRETNDAVTATAGGCGEPIPCMGGECLDDPPETNTNWVDTMTVMQAVEWAGKDAESCDVNTGECQLFRGEAMQCQTRKEYIPIPCCNDPPDISLTAWLQVAKASYKGLQTSGALDWLQANTIDTPGFWQDAYNGSAYVWDAISDPFISAWDSLTESAAGWIGESGGAEAVGSEFTATALADFKQEVMNQAYRWINEFFPELANTLFQESATAAGNYVLNQTIVSQVASFASFMMTAYMYYQAAMIAYQLFSDCADDDGKQIEFNYKREKLRVCHMMSSRCKNTDFFGATKSEYRKACCFSSPLSRILQEQIRSQLGISWGSSCSPQCRAITLAELQTVDWGLVDLSEWTAILFEAGIFPDSASEQAIMSDKDLSTTNREDEDYYVPPSSPERFENRSQHVDWKATEEQMRQQAWENVEDAPTVNSKTPYGFGGTSAVGGGTPP